MASTEFSTGYEKSSSRVLQPPGGGSSNIFGSTDYSSPTAKVGSNGDTPKATTNNVVGNQDDRSPVKTAADLKSRNTSSNIFNVGPGDDAVQTKKQPEDETEEKKDDEEEEGKEEEKEQTKVEESPTKNKGAFNPITGEAYQKENQKSVHTSTKVRQPPGGASSGLW